MKADYNIDQATGRMLAVYLWIEDCEPNLLNTQSYYPAWKNCEADMTCRRNTHGDLISRITRLRLYGPVSMDAIFKDMSDRPFAFDFCWEGREKKFLANSVPVCWALDRKDQEQPVESLT